MKLDQDVRDLGATWCCAKPIPRRAPDQSKAFWNVNTPNHQTPIANHLDVFVFGDDEVSPYAPVTRNATSTGTQIILAAWCLDNGESTCGRPATCMTTSSLQSRDISNADTGQTSPHSRIVPSSLQSYGNPDQGYLSKPPSQGFLPLGD